MIRSSTALALIALAAAGPRQGPSTPQLTLKEEAVFLEYFPATGQATMVVDAESEAALQRVQVRDPRGVAILELEAGRGDALSLSSFTVETAETDVPGLAHDFPEGDYAIRAWTAGGQEVWGSATLSHDLLAAPIVVHPAERAERVATDLSVAWVPDPAAIAYRVTLEQDENDGLSVSLPGDAHSFEVPPGVLAPGTETQLELAAIGSNGNLTAVEVVFTTR